MGKRGRNKNTQTYTRKTTAEKEKDTSKKPAVTNLREEYERLDGMDRVARIAEIDVEIERIKQAINDMDDQVAEMEDESEAEKLEESINAARKERRKLELEKKKIASFESVKLTLERIAKKQEDLIEQKTKRVDSIKAELAKKKDERAKIDEEQAEIDKKIEKTNISAQTVIEALKAEDIDTDVVEAKFAEKLKDLKDRKGELTKQGIALDEIISENEQNLRTYEEGRSEFDGKINMCKLPWETLLNGMSWKEISVITPEQLEEKLKDWDKPKEKDEEQKGKDDDGKTPPAIGGGARSQILGGGGAREQTPQPVTHDDPDDTPKTDDDKDKPDDTPKDDDKDKDGDSSTPPIEKKPWYKRIFDGIKARFAKLFGKKEAVGAVEYSPEEKAYRVAKADVIKINARIKNLEIKLKNYETNARTKIVEMISKNEAEEVKEAKGKLLQNSLGVIQELATFYIAQGDFTRDEMLDKIREKELSEGKAGSDTLQLLVPGEWLTDKTIANVKSAISIQMPYLTLSQMQDRKEAWKVMGLYTDKEIEAMEDKIGAREALDKGSIEDEMNVAKAELTKAEKAEAVAKQKLDASKAPDAPASTTGPHPTGANAQRVAFQADLQKGVNADPAKAAAAAQAPEPAKDAPAPEPSRA